MGYIYISFQEAMHYAILWTMEFKSYGILLSKKNTTKVARNTINIGWKFKLKDPAKIRSRSTSVIYFFFLKSYELCHSANNGD